MKCIYLVRHCEATGQLPDAALTAQGAVDAIRLRDFFIGKEIEYIVSSPFLRAIDSIRPLANTLGIPVFTDIRLEERVLSGIPMADWEEKLKLTYIDADLKFQGGESSAETMARAISVIKELCGRPEKRLLIVTHGALLSIIMKYYINTIGYSDWKKLTTPDIYLLSLNKQECVLEHLWD